MPTTEPSVIVPAGPNGAGKTTAALLLRQTLGVVEFVNADTIAQGPAAFDPDGKPVGKVRRKAQNVRQPVAGGASGVLAGRSGASAGRAAR